MCTDWRLFDATTLNSSRADIGVPLAKQLDIKNSLWEINADGKTLALESKLFSKDYINNLSKVSDSLKVIMLGMRVVITQSLDDKMRFFFFPDHYVKNAIELKVKYLGNIVNFAIS